MMPMVRAPTDQMRFGLQTPLAAETTQGHPLENFREQNEFEMKCDLVRRTYGGAAAMRLKAERHAVEQIQRLPGLPSSFTSLQTVLGEDETITFEDVLNDPFERPEAPMFKIHEAMEVKLGMY
eukprot:CAMPEP_0114344140 /NCGR_PEP_ID=MMETSP0101-20121206/11188_1 /TAXON_ID=38822 ORGANISM="Pteridomonas danica, Strain PT" /NCGR_SAMPLE_ID=MMETSP0101 /ASSEMBLY_ACC=CAM_ASM_000211 /LENGTH=122 /DNA_ID=CAMNT_0001479323 /DNA_START=38 /DNA_END=406 /DNA_ORIENTATION=+